MTKRGEPQEENTFSERAKNKQNLAQEDQLAWFLQCAITLKFFIDAWCPGKSIPLQHNPDVQEAEPVQAPRAGERL